MIGRVIRRASRPPEAAPSAPASGIEVVAPRPAPVREGWTNLHGEVVGEFRRLGMAPSVDQLLHARGERRVP